MSRLARKHSFDQNVWAMNALPILVAVARLSDYLTA